MAGSGYSADDEIATHDTLGKNVDNKLSCDAAGTPSPPCSRRAMSLITAAGVSLVVAILAAMLSLLLRLTQDDAGALGVSVVAVVSGICFVACWFWLSVITALRVLRQDSVVNPQDVED